MRIASAGGQRVLRLLTARGDASDLAGASLGEPQRAIWPLGDGVGRASRWEGELGDYAFGGDAPDFAPADFSKPEGFIRFNRDASRTTASRRHGELGNLALGRDAPDLVAAGLGEPQVAIRPLNDSVGIAVGRGDRVLGDQPRTCYRPDLVGPDFREPQNVIRTDFKGPTYRTTSLC